ncbi:MAG: hypothetical protein PHQ23_17210 [Candidatus Wallbacteria bacterium]|nr:hypothetical protein [Candidatus Wallbacteria bacterium]
MPKFELTDSFQSDLWDSLVDNSPQGTVFIESDFLSSTSTRHEKYLIFKGQDLKAGICVCISENGEDCILDDLVVYNGLIFREDERKKDSRARLERFELTEFTIDFLTKRFRTIEISLSPHFEDIRPFLWHNYHEQAPGKRFIVDVRYTSYLDISGLGDPASEETNPVFQNMIRLRQRGVRKMRQIESRFSQSDDPNLIADFYRKMMNAKGETVPQEKLDRMRSLSAYLIKSGKGAQFRVTDSSGPDIYAINFGLDRKRAYALFAAGKDTSPDMYEGTIAYWDSFHSLARNSGVSEIDFEGVNSPKRSWFKLGFGGDIRAYYQVSLKRSD